MIAIECWALYLGEPVTDPVDAPSKHANEI